MSDRESEREIGMTRDAEASCVRIKSGMGEGDKIGGEGWEGEEEQRERRRKVGRLWGTNRGRGMGRRGGTEGKEEESGKIVGNK